MLRDEIGLGDIGRHHCLRLTPPVISFMHKLVIGIDVLQQMTLLDGANAASLPGGIQAMSQGIGPRIELVIIHGFINANAPNDDGGVIAILQDHVLNVSKGLLLPRLIPNMLPARHLREYEKTKLITAVQKILALRIMGGADCIDAKLLF